MSFIRRLTHSKYAVVDMPLCDFSIGNSVCNPETTSQSRDFGIGILQSRDQMLCRYVRVSFSGNVSLVQMFIKPAIYVGSTNNNVQLL